jgi:hypothetical protein
MDVQGDPTGAPVLRWGLLFSVALLLTQVAGNIPLTDRSPVPRPEAEGCTIGVASGSATADGRPLLWKTRDNADLPVNAITFNDNPPIRYIAVINAGETEIWMGVNERGFAILNATASDLPAGSGSLGNGGLMQIALATCNTVDDFTRLLDSTNITGRRTQGNFGTIDAEGSAKMFEVGGSVYWTFDANSGEEAPRGYLLRTNFSMTGGGQVSRDRYQRALGQTEAFLDGDTLDYFRILRYQSRDFSDHSSRQISLPFTGEWQSGIPLGYVSSAASVCRNKTCSAAAIVGVAEGEDARLSTLWTILGQPATGIAVPYWPVGAPPELAGDPKLPALYDVATHIRDLIFDSPLGEQYVDSYKLVDECGRGVWSETFPAENMIVRYANSRLREWRSARVNVDEMLQVERVASDRAYATLSTTWAHLLQRSACTVANDVAWKNQDGKELTSGSVVQLIWAGPDGTINPPGSDRTNFGMPTGDDSLIGYFHAVGENSGAAGMFRFQCIGWNGSELGRPARGDAIYVRVFNRESIGQSTYYSDSQVYRVNVRAQESFVPQIPGDRTGTPLKLPAPDAHMPIQNRVVANYPNPFNPTTYISYSLDNYEHVTLTIYDLLGREVSQVVNEVQQPGTHRVSWGGEMYASGVYYYMLVTESSTKGKSVSIKSMVLLR